MVVLCERSVSFLQVQKMLCRVLGKSFHLLVGKGSLKVASGFNTQFRSETRDERTSEKKEEIQKEGDSIYGT